MNLKASLIVLFIAGAATTTAGYAFADDDVPTYTIEDVTACSADAMRLCQDKMPDLKAIEACMSQNFDKLSHKCQVRFKR